MKGFALGLASKQRRNITRKSPHATSRDVKLHKNRYVTQGDLSRGRVMSPRVTGPSKLAYTHNFCVMECVSRSFFRPLFDTQCPFIHCPLFHFSIVHCYILIVSLSIVPFPLSIVSDISSPLRGKEPSIANASNIDTLLGATESSEVTQPPEAIQDKVHFIFNNISISNLQQKVQFPGILTEGPVSDSIEVDLRIFG